MSENLFKPKSRQKDIVIQKLEDECLIYDLKTNKAFCLNETSAEVWQRCDGNKTVSEITEELRQNVNPSINEDFVILALGQFKKDGLLEDEVGISNMFEGFSRREMIRKVGFASLVTLPVVSSLVAPHSVNAQSCIANGNNCSSNPTCCSGCCGDPSFNVDPRQCVTPGLDGHGTACISNCECSGGLTCRPNSPRQCVFPLNSVASGGTCVVDNECASGNCVGEVPGTGMTPTTAGTCA